MNIADPKPWTAITDVVAHIMSDFACETGLTSDELPRRYLWTDAFAVCNFLELYRRTQEPHYLSLAVQLVDQVHHVLGRHRPDDSRTGWLSNLPDSEAIHHPTMGGLRIGKPLPESDSGDTPNQPVGWDRDGQYYHYLTKWMHALHRMYLTTRDTRYLEWAVDLAQTVHTRFSHIDRERGRKSLFWKMSVDLTRPLVTSMGQHDPLDGLITYEELDTAVIENAITGMADLRAAITDLRDMCDDMDWQTNDTLGAGGVLSDMLRLSQLVVMGKSTRVGLLSQLIITSLTNLHSIMDDITWSLGPQHRLPFRELGFAIGLRAIESFLAVIEGHPELVSDIRGWTSASALLQSHVPFAEAITRYWLDPQKHQHDSWSAHRDINTVMLATSLTPETFLAAI